MNSADSRGLIVFLKNPQSTNAKTRLAATLGEHKAQLIYTHLVDFTVNLVTSMDVQAYLYFADSIPPKDSPLHNRNSIFRSQHGADLGERMMHAFNETLAMHNSMIIIGSDCGDLHPEMIDRAFEELAYTDVVIGPSTDGGYYLLGMNSPIPGIFENIPWSTDSVFSETVATLLANSSNFSILPTLSDVDIAEDWEALCNRSEYFRQIAADINDLTK